MRGFTVIAARDDKYTLLLEAENGHQLQEDVFFADMDDQASTDELGAVAHERLQRLEAALADPATPSPANEALVGRAFAVGTDGSVTDAPAADPAE